ncbi:hypothetical protein CIPAW_11G014800 [Carya illinoinensis]|uniref:Protein SIEVE ELEMENT OCCLUSION B-like n=1 Tax=Carya illinoinensis TaxID=32201 RepID=A0A8T1NY02_CARIL|nr:hypothetical protein CIPAW_11G014800 [Carya illinoinensis]
MLKDHDRRMFALSDDNALMKQIIVTHAPDGREVDVEPILQIIGDVFHRATPSLDGVLNGTLEHVDTEDKTVPALDFDDILEALAYLIYKISCELSCKCSGGGDAHATTMALLNTLTSFSWDSKVVLTLAAFAVNYGEFWLVGQLCTGTRNPLAKSVAFLKQLPNIVEYSSSLKAQFEALNKLIKAIMDVATCIVEFTELPSQYISDETPAVKAVTSHLPAATYWTIRSVVACSTQIASLIGLRLENSTALTTVAWELSSLAHKVTNIHEHLKSQIAFCYQHIEEKTRHLEYFHTLVRLFETLHLDNFKILRALLHPKEELVIGSSKKKVNIEVLKRKHVLLLISDLDIPHDEITILGHLYQQDPMRKTEQTQYEVVWLPVVDRLSPHADQEKVKIKFQELLSMMQWYSVIDPWTIEPAVIKYIKEVWRFNKKSILVSLDPQGRLASSNALHMMWIWGTLAIPFSIEKEETLWKSEFWGLPLLIDGIDTTVIDSMREGNIVCLYGGEDIEWIRKFTTSAKNVAKAANITLDLLYVGKSNAKERVQKANSIISSEQLSHFWADLTYIWFFWTRLESMLHSKMMSGKTVENDPIVEEVITMLSFDGSEKGWAVVSGGPPDHEEIIARGSGEIALKTIEDFGNWKDDVVNIGFVPAFKEHLRKLHTPQHCKRLILPGIPGEIPERIVCAECHRPMEKYFMYRCYTD